MEAALDPAELSALEQRIDTWLGELVAEYDHIASVERGDDGPIRWLVRMRGEEKDVTTVWLTLGQRTLRHETYVLPAPEENVERFYEQLLRRNIGLVGVAFAIGDTEAIFLRGDISAQRVTKDDVDRILGTVFACVEQSFRALLSVGFASRYAS